MIAAGSIGKQTVRMELCGDAFTQRTEREGGRGMTNKDSPIGVFDSGLGGVSVLRACARLLPHEDFLFFGDSANAPYGEKTLEEVRALTLRRAKELLDRGAKAIVVACNTATSAAISLLREQYPQVPVIGIEPAVKPAAQADDSSQVIVMATPLTIHEEKYQKLAAAFCHEAGVISLPCRGLAELVEEGHREGPVIDAYLQELFLPFRHCNVRPGLHPLPLRGEGHPEELRPAGGDHRRQRRHRPAAQAAACRPGPPLGPDPAGEGDLREQHPREGGGQPPTL